MRIAPNKSSIPTAIWVVGAQKVVPDLDTALRRVRTYSLPLESQRAQEAYGFPSMVGKILILEQEALPDRGTVGGTMLGVTRGVGRAHIARAVLEAIAYQTRDVTEAMRAESGRSLSELRADGGAAVNGWLMQFQADILGVPVNVPEVTETTSLGSAYLAGLVAGVWDDRAELRAKRRTAHRYEPRMAADQRDELYGRWREALERARNWAKEE